MLEHLLALLRPSPPPTTERELRRVLESTQAEVQALRVRVQAARVDELEATVAELTESEAQLVDARVSLQGRLADLRAQSAPELSAKIEELEEWAEHTWDQLDLADKVRVDLFHALSAARAEVRVMSEENARLRAMLGAAQDELKLRAPSVLERLRGLFARP